MVTVTGVEQRKNAKEELFNCLIISGDLEVVTSQATGKPYFTVRKMSIPCTFDEALARTMIGKQLKGEIQRLECEPYEYTNSDTAEVMTLTHTYQYCPNPSNLAEVIHGEPVLA
jgi:hypothetical protein